MSDQQDLAYDERKLWKSLVDYPIDCPICGHDNICKVIYKARYSPAVASQAGFTCTECGQYYLLTSLVLPNTMYGKLQIICNVVLSKRSKAKHKAKLKAKNKLSEVSETTENTLD